MTTALRVGPLTWAQSQLFGMHRAGVSPATLNLSYGVLIQGALDIARLREAMVSVLAGHESLRSTYHAEDGSCLARVRSAAFVADAVDLDPVPAASWRAVADFLREEREGGFALAEQAPVRARLLRVDQDVHVLALTVHHIAADGWSMGVLAGELSKAYVAGAAPVPDADHRRVECIDLAVAELDWLAGPRGEKEHDWWAGHLQAIRTDSEGSRRGGFDTLEAPRSVRPSDANTIGRIAVEVPAELAEAVHELSVEAGVSPYTLFVVAAALVVSAERGLAVPLVGTLVANRMSAARSEVVGALYNAVLLRLDLTGDPSYSECVLRGASEIWAALEHQGFPYAELAATLVGADGRPVGPDVAVVFDQYPLQELELEGCRTVGLNPFGACAVHEQAVDGMPIAARTFAVRQVGRRFSLSVLFAPAECSADEARAGLAHLCLALEALCTKPSEPMDGEDLQAGCDWLFADETCRCAPPRGPEDVFATGIHVVAAVDAVSPAVMTHR